MNFDSLRSLCNALPGVVEEVKLESDLSFSVDGNMFCITSDDSEGGVSFKVKDAEFREMTQREGVIPAPYMARHQWVYVLDFSWLTDAEWEHYIRQSYDLVRDRLAEWKPENA